MAEFATWKECGWLNCQKQFKPANRSNRYRYGQGQPHDGAKYCSDACKQAAYRLRLKMGAVEARKMGLRAA
jgi:hypothetical protein